MYIQCTCTHTEPNITILDCLVKCPTMLNFVRTCKKFGWLQFLGEHIYYNVRMYKLLIVSKMYHVFSGLISC